MSFKREKGPNMTAVEKERLRSVVLRYSNTVENKKTDAVSNRQKNEAWEKIRNELNAQPGVIPRDVSKYRKAWDNIKKARRTLNSEKIERMKTGGGVPDLEETEPDPELDALDQNIEIMGTFDSDYFYENRNNPSTALLVQGS